LADQPRARAVLDLVVEKSGWEKPTREGQARGIALSFGFRSYSALVVEFSLDDRGRVLVERITIVVDPGTLVAPDLAKAQLQSGLIFGLSAALGAQITLREGEVVQQNFDGYPILRMQGTPDMDIHFAPSGDEPGGMGEVAVPTVAPALANALAALRGERLTSLPITKTVKASPLAGARNVKPISPTAQPTQPTPQPPPRKPAMPDVDITATENGPYVISGPITIHDHDGRAVDVPDGDSVALCRCGGSGNKPFCDGTHAAIDFDGTLAN
jgi:CDGSH-type Zn-finger protein